MEDEDIEKLFRNLKSFSITEDMPGKGVLVTRDFPRTRSQQGYQHDYLCLELPPDKADPNLISLEGHFRLKRKAVDFFARTDRDDMEEIHCSLCEDRLLSLIRLLEKKRYEIELDGDILGSVFQVNEIHIIPSRSAMGASAPVEAKANDKRLQTVLHRAFAPVEESSAVVFSTLEDLEMVYCLCRDDYPPSIQEWAELHLESLQLPGLGSTDKRHILKGLSYMLNIDWRPRPIQVPDLGTVREMLDRRFFGLASVKRQILEVAARLRQSGSIPTWGILLNGPPGVGKTAFANFLAQLLGLPMGYLDFSVLGRDSEGISGTPRIYDNAKPGLVVEQIYGKRTANLVMVLNELDKAVEGKSGGSVLDALLPLLDGMGFTDTYIETAIPTDGIIFIATSNEAEKLSGPILDRFYRIDIPAYSQEEKGAIFDRYILPQALDRAGLDAEAVGLTEDAKLCLLRDYARAPGVRDLAQIAEKMVSSYLLKREETGGDSIVFSLEDLRKMLGPPKIVERNFAMVPGMAFSARCVNGSVQTFVLQAAVRPGSGELHLINIECRHQREYCRQAYEAVNFSVGGRLTVMDVVLAASVPLDETDARNYMGCAVCAAILSALLKDVKYAEDDLFLGGCDLYGCLYLDEPTLDLYVEQLAGHFKVIYGAVGMAKLIYESHPLASLSIVEAPDIFALFQMMGKNLRHLWKSTEDKKEERGGEREM